MISSQDSFNKKGSQIFHKHFLVPFLVDFKNKEQQKGETSVLNICPEVILMAAV